MFMARNKRESLKRNNEKRKKKSLQALQNKNIQTTKLSPRELNGKSQNRHTLQTTNAVTMHKGSEKDDSGGAQTVIGKVLLLTFLWCMLIILTQCQNFKHHIYMEIIKGNERILKHHKLKSRLRLS